MAAGLPSGTVTFLFTDLVDSTRLWEGQTDAMRGAVDDLQTLTRGAVEDHHGVIVKSVGDGAMAAFQDADAALDAAIELQRTVTARSWPVRFELRVGLHSGHAQPEGGDYHAPAVNRADRVAGAAHGGQVLLSESTATLVGPERTIDLDEHDLKGLPRQHLYQARAEGLRSEFPALSTARRPSRLPSPSTSFIGRQAEVSAVAALVADHPLVTLTGTGGSGKTRLSLAVASHVADRFPGGIAFADLAAASDDDSVATTIATALGILADDPTERVAAYLAERTILCILDNCEHVLDAVADVVDAILARGGHSRLLATSREPLAVAGEQVCAVTPLAVDTEAIELFEARAREAGAPVSSDEATRAAVAELCRRLDGIPLAVELAAARATHLSPTQLVERLDDRFRLLTGARRRVSRHQTLAATLDWSHDLLGPDEQAMLRRLAVLPDSFSLATAEQLAGVDGSVDVLGSLVAKSLVQRVPQSDGTLRYRLLETVRLYAAERLATAGEADAQHTAHRDVTIAWLESIPLEERWLSDRDVLASERASIRAAVQWSEDAGEVGALAQIVSGVDWTRSADWHDGIRWLEWALARREALPAPLLLRTLTSMAAASSPAGLPGGPAMHDALAINAPGDLGLQATARCWWALHHSTDSVRTGAPTRGEVERMAEEGVTLAQRASAPWRLYCGLLAGLMYTGLSMPFEVVDERAEHHLRAALDATRAVEDYDTVKGAAREYLALSVLVRGEAAEALQVLSPVRRDPLVYPMLSASQDSVRILALAELERVDEARERLVTAHDLVQRIDITGGGAQVAVVAAALCATQGDWEAASRLLGAGAISATRAPITTFLYFNTREKVRRALPVDRGRALRDEGKALGADRALAQLLS